MSELKLLKEFQKIIPYYQPSHDVTGLAENCRLLMLAGVTSSGRNTVIAKLKEIGGFHNIVSDTTRKPRTNNGVKEENGVEYFFKTEEDFLERLNDGKYLEAAIIHNQQVSGISIEELELLAGLSEVGVTDMENEGTKRVLKVAPEAAAVFLIPPDFQGWMERITNRGQLDQEEIKRRLASAEKEIEDALENPIFKIVINDEVQDTAEQIIALVNGHKRPDSEEIEIKRVAWRLLNDLKQEIRS